MSKKRRRKKQKKELCSSYNLAQEWIEVGWRYPSWKPSIFQRKEEDLKSPNVMLLLIPNQDNNQLTFFVIMIVHLNPQVEYFIIIRHFQQRHLNLLVLPWFSNSLSYPYCSIFLATSSYCSFWFYFKYICLFHSPVLFSQFQSPSNILYCWCFSKNRKQRIFIFISSWVCINGAIFKKKKK